MTKPKLARLRAPELSVSAVDPSPALKGNLPMNRASPESRGRFPLSPSEEERVGVRGPPWDSGTQSASECRGILSPLDGNIGVWTFWISQPEGLPEGSRRSPRVFWGGDLRATAQEKSCTLAGVPDSSRPRLLEIDVVPEPITCCENRGAVDPECEAVSPTNGGLWHPSRVLDHPKRYSGGRSPFALNDHRLPLRLARKIGRDKPNPIL